MKKIFVIQCNAKKNSCKEIYVQTYINEAEKCKHEVRTVNLYDLDIDYLRFNGDDIDNTLTEELKKAQNNILWADQLVFVYPIWWLGIPAIMKSFIDKTFTEDVVAKYGKYGPIPLLKGKTAVIMQSYDMPFLWMKYFCKDLPFKYWQAILTPWCGIKIEKRFDFDGISDVNEKRKQKWINNIKKFVHKI